MSDLEPACTRAPFGPSATTALVCTSDGDASWKKKCSVLELDEATLRLTSYFDDASSIVFSDTTSFDTKTYITRLTSRHAIMCYSNQNIPANEAPQM